MPVWTIEEIRNAQSLNEDNTIFDLEMNHPQFGWIPYTLKPDDPDGSISNEELLSMIGSDYAAYVPPTSEEIIARQAGQARAERDRQLRENVDVMVSNNLRWNDLTDEQRTEWTNYRTALLGVPQQSGFPQNINWPTIPSGFR
tara:strand:+ start:338 stop:766 length:429 start_codon:yes stop_codon:yes gene_type:complete